MKKFASFVALLPISIAVVSILGCGSSGNSTQSCDAAAFESSFADSCAFGLADVFLCWNPDGDCMTSDLTTTFENGSSLESSLQGELVFRGPSGELCGTATAMAGSGATQEVSFLTRSNDTYLYQINPTSEEITIVCPSGERVTVDTEQTQAVQACGSSAGAISACNNVNPGDGPDLNDDDFGNIGQSCTNDSDCPDALGFDFVCCKAADSTCLPKQSCDFL